MSFSMNRYFLKMSVVIPVYNRASTILQSVGSALSQTFPPSEVIVVDDCSNDGTIETLSEITDSRLKIISLAVRTGAQGARNAGIRAAQGDWIAFLDSDDEWLPGKLEKQVDALAKVNFDPETVVHCNATLLDSATGQRVDDDLTLMEGEDVYRLLLTKPGPMFPAMLVSRVALEKINYLDEHVPSHQEWDTAIRLARFCRFIHLQEKLFIYRVNSHDTISKNLEKSIQGYRYVIDKHREDIICLGGEDLWTRHQLVLIRKALDGHLWRIADSYFTRVPFFNIKVLVLTCCRILHLRPEILLSFYESMVRFLNAGAKESS